MLSLSMFGKRSLLISITIKLQPLPISIEYHTTVRQTNIR